MHTNIYLFLDLLVKYKPGMIQGLVFIQIALCMHWWIVKEGEGDHKYSCLLCMKLLALIVLHHSISSLLVL